MIVKFLLLLFVLMVVFVVLVVVVVLLIYVDLVDYLYFQVNWDVFYDLCWWLMVGFDDVCVDMFCEGVYSDYEVFQLWCFVVVGIGIVSDCCWVFVVS